jgi:protein-tyrosine phosphatase
MVCMGNICRSPMAEGVLRAKLAQAGLAKQVLVDSAGTHGFQRGGLPDPRAVAQAGRRGYRLDGIRSRPVVAADFSRFDLLLAMDRDNLATLRDRCPPPEQARLQLLLPFSAASAAGSSGAAQPVDEVPDPYYGSVAGFDHALDLIEPACDGLLLALQRRLVSGTAAAN